eukprot:5376433-Pleurochrysis_carterae.AAC.1
MQGGSSSMKGRGGVGTIRHPGHIAEAKVCRSSMVRTSSAWASSQHQRKIIAQPALRFSASRARNRSIRLNTYHRIKDDHATLVQANGWGCSMFSE